MVALWTPEMDKFKQLMAELQTRVPMVGWDNTPDSGVATFSMGDYICGDRDRANSLLRGKSFEEKIETIPTCGTACCALGWCSLIISPKPHIELFSEYINRVFVVDKKKFSTQQLSQLSRWLFSGQWAGIAPEPNDVLRRVAFFEADPSKFFVRVAALIREAESTEAWLATLWKELCDES